MSAAQPGPADERAVLEAVPKTLYIGGSWRAASGGGMLTVEDPSTEEGLVEVADAQVEDSLAALGAAAGMQGEWGASAYFPTVPRSAG